MTLAAQFVDQGAERQLIDQMRRNLGNLTPDALGPDAPPLSIDFLEAGGAKAGQPMPPDQTVSATDAAASIAQVRQAIGENVEAAEDEQIKQAIDALRGADNQQQVPEPQPQQQTEAAALHPNDVTAAPEAQPVSDEAEIAALLQNNPKLLAALQAEIAQRQQTYEAGLQNNAALVVGSIQARHPELRGVHPSEWHIVLNTLNQSNPQRAGEILGEFERTRGFFQQVQQVETARQQQAQAQQQNWMREYAGKVQRAAQVADAEFGEYARAHGITNEQLGEIAQETREMLRDDYGLTDDRISFLWNWDENFRSAPAQKMMLDLVQHRRAKRALPGKLVRDAPQVQRPGSPLERGSEEEWNTRRLNERINQSKGLDQVRAAAELIAARRRAARR